MTPATTLQLHRARYSPSNSVGNATRSATWQRHLNKHLVFSTCQFRVNDTSMSIQHNSGRHYTGLITPGDWEWEREEGRFEKTDYKLIFI